MSVGLWQSVALFLGGIVVSGVAMILRGDFLGRQAAKDVESRLSRQTKAAEERLEKGIDVAERRLNSRIDREMAVIGDDLREIKDGIIRLETRLEAPNMKGKT